MRHVLVFVMVTAISSPAFSQARKPVRKAPPAPAAAALKKGAPEMTCPAPLGVGVKTRLTFCEVMAGRDPAGGVVIQVPPHKGPATLTFDLHNLHTYSDEQVKAHRAYTRYTATIGVLTLDNTLLSRAVVQSEFRAATDLVDRVGGGAGKDVRLSLAVPLAAGRLQHGVGLQVQRAVQVAGQRQHGAAGGAVAQDVEHGFVHVHFDFRV